MNVLAIELSSREGSVALARDDRVVAEYVWSDTERDSRQLFDRIRDVIGEGDIGWDGIDLYAVGRGPGSFSGMRIALSVARALALPDRKPVFTISSGETLAVQTARESAHISNRKTPIAVVGDARRRQLWYGIFIPEPEGRMQLRDWSLVAPADLADRLPDHTLIVSPEYHRLRDVCVAIPERGIASVREDRYPSAATLGQLAIQKMERGEGSEPMEPLYMHPAVEEKSREYRVDGGMKKRNI